jgi:hypothetical protein
MCRLNDGILFHVHKLNLKASAGGFAAPEFETPGEIIRPAETALTLELLFQFCYPDYHHLTNAHPSVALPVWIIDRVHEFTAPWYPIVEDTEHVPGSGPQQKKTDAGTGDKRKESIYVVNRLIVVHLLEYRQICTSLRCQVHNYAPRFPSAWYNCSQ